MKTENRWEKMCKGKLRKYVGSKGKETAQKRKEKPRKEGPSKEKPRKEGASKEELNKEEPRKEKLLKGE